jgi:uncharacterized protein with HEPN domain
MGVDVLAIWKSVERDLPELQQQINKLLMRMD